MSKTRTMYLRDQNRNPVGCLAISCVVESGVTRTYYQLSAHNPADKFDRAIARKIAEGRLLTHPVSVAVMEPCNAHTIATAVMEDLSLSSRSNFTSTMQKFAPRVSVGVRHFEEPNRKLLMTVPQRVVAAARAWLYSNTDLSV